jgi:nucleoid DNA-binding protein
LKIADVTQFNLSISNNKEGWQTMAKATAKPKAASKSEVLNNLATATNMSRKEISAVLDALTAEISKSLGKKGNGVFQIPGLCKILRKQNPAKPAREGINPATGEKIMIKAKPASTAVKVRPLKSLKDMVK